MTYRRTSSVLALPLLLCGVSLSFILGGCADSLPTLPKVSDLNPFKEKQIPLPGKRTSLAQTQDKSLGEIADGSEPVVLPPPHANTAWAQPGGEANNAPGHLVLAAAIRQIWSADAGTGSSNKGGRVTASPIVVDGRIFTLDAAGRVSAFSSTGSALWSISLTPDTEKPSFFSFSGTVGGYGGGLASDGSRIFAATGFGTLSAIDPQSGKVLWTKELGSPIRSSPTAADGRVFVTTLEGRFFCLSGTDGSELWIVRGLPQQASLVLNTSPAVDGDVVVVPYPSGDLVAIKASDGSALWSESLARSRGASQLASLSNAARPAIDQGTVFAVGHSGRMIATQSLTGTRLWSINVPSTQTPWVAGGTVFVVDTSGQLIAIKRGDGKIQWTVKLPGSTQWSGPTLAGGILWLASNTGLLVSVDAVTGRVIAQQDLGSPVYIAPVVAQGQMFILTDDATLLALN